MPNNYTPQTWGYLLTGTVSERLIRTLEGQEALSNYSENWQIHERARDLIFTLLGVESCLFYVRRFNIDQHDNRLEIWTLTLATDQNHFDFTSRLNQFPQFLQSDTPKTLQLRSTAYRNNSGCLGIYEILLLDSELGKEDAFSRPFNIHLVPDINQEIGIPREAFEIITSQPLRLRREFVPTETQRKRWGEFLNVEKRLAESKQFCVRFSSHNLLNIGDDNRITFKIDENFAFGINSNRLSNSLTSEELWERIQQAKYQNIELIINTNQLHGNNNRIKLGIIERIRLEQKDIRVEIQPDLLRRLQEEVTTIEEDELTLPPKAYLLYKNVGSLAQIEWKRTALVELERGQTHNINLGKFFFDATQARPIEQEIVLNYDDLLSKNANDGQKAAVEAVLATKDLVLLQGPPGTGKTTVITELCYQIASKGGKVLIVSQANLAVDNALERLPHHPLLRPLRIGNSANGNEEQPFSEQNVVHRWRENTARDCEDKLLPKIKIFAGLSPLLNHQYRFYAYIEIETTYPDKKEQLNQYLENLELLYQSKQASYEQIEAKQQEVEQLLSGLNDLVESNAILQINQEHKLQKFRSDLDNINLAKEQLQQWYINSNSQIYKILKQCLQQRQYLTEDLIILPSHILSILNEHQSNWTECISDNKREISTLIDSLRTSDRVCEVANKINWLISQKQGILSQISINKNHVNQLVEQLTNRISNQDCLSAIDELYRLMSRDVRIINSLENSQERLNAALRLTAIQSQSELIIQQSQPPLPEPILREITVKIVENISKTVKILLRRLQERTEQQINETLNNQDNLESTLNHFYVIPSTQKYLDSHLLQIKDTANELTEDIENLRQQIDIKKQESQDLEITLNTERTWWCNIWDKIPDDFKLNINSTDLFNLDFLNTIPHYFDDWQEKLTVTETWLNRYQTNMENWIQRLRYPSADDLESFRRSYVDNVNIVGITCVSAGNPTLLQKFSSFDVVIIDEVSKSTPPELLIPALKGKKVVMIGDYRQLPPILDEESLDELAKEIQTPIEELAFLEESWFHVQFEAAKNQGSNITKKLTTQYRMHPQIMEAINQFYDEGDGGLTCGLSDPDSERAHNFNTQSIRENNHIIWVKMPLKREYIEQRQGTSRYNQKEIECIKKLCQQMDDDWAEKVAAGEPKKEIGIITFYGAQLGKIREMLSRNTFPNLNIITGTVDRFQGMEKPVIIVSMVRNNHNNNFGFAQTPERVNVAFSRAKELLVILGCHDLFTRLPIYKEVSNVVERYQGFLDENLRR
ncbi:MAG: AAA family ATPase [Aphanizomenon flos-aquae Clear-A1]|jgi:superfamily I DNA and/or RNA helicase|nr:AAA family ATPase [Aphanizomenon flos-aquae Clear-A1]